MKTMGISEFKAKCIGAIREARRTGTPIMITRRGQPWARLDPISEASERRELGRLRHMLTIKGDIVHAGFTDEWELEG